jgi:hypothetical protein
MPYLESESIFMENLTGYQQEIAMLAALYKMSIARADQTEPIQEIKTQYPRIFKTRDESQNTPKLLL